MNNSTIAVSVYCSVADMKKYSIDISQYKPSDMDKFIIIATVEAQKSVAVPLFIAYHCRLYLGLTNTSYVQLS